MKRSQQGSNQKPGSKANSNLGQEPFLEEKEKHGFEKKPNIKESTIEKALTELKSERIARLIGLIAHLAYWKVFGHFNQLPLDKYHTK